MKKIVLVLSLFASLFASAQQHEVKLDLLDIIAFKSLDLSYEYILNEEASVGLSAFVNFNEQGKGLYHEDLQFVPYFRLNFTTVGAFDVFGEVFGSLNFGDNEYDYTNIEGDTVEGYEDFTDLAIGIGAGIKHVSGNGYVFEFNAGVGRNLLDNADDPLLPRLGLSFGKQF